jgi:hypothetical protein
MTPGGWGRRRPYRSLPLVEAAGRLLAVRNTLLTGVSVDSAQEIDANRFVRGLGSIWLAVFRDHDKPPLGVDALDRVEPQQAPTPDEDPVSADREPLPARLWIVDQLDDQPDPSAAKVKHCVTGRVAE